MKIGLVSDIHIDHNGPSVLPLIVDAAEVADVLVIAGDLTTSAHLCGAIRDIGGMREKPTLIVLGNHDYAGRIEPVVTWQKAVHQASETKGVRMLGPGGYEAFVGDVKFVGSTLWYPKTQQSLALSNQWYDFCYIPKAAEWVWSQHEADLSAIQKANADIVITHMLPNSRCVSDEFKGSGHNCFFNAEVTLPYRPKLWLFGHTHTETDFAMDGTRYVCHPRGYPRERSKLPHEPVKFLEV